jgi:carbon-monoxide dehydrogenase large subunit
MQGYKSMKFGIGQSALRKEDVRFLTGNGRYIDDIAPKNLTFAYVVRSPHAHARVVSVDIEAASGCDNVTIVTSVDIKDRLSSIGCRFALDQMGGPSLPNIAQPHLASDIVRYVGQPVAFVVADSLDQARDAGELIDIEYEELPPLVASADAIGTDAPELHADAPGNISYDWTAGDQAATDAAFANAAHIVKTHVVNQRLIVTAMEPRGIVIQYNDDDRWEAWVGSQGAHAMRDGMAGLLQVEPSRLHVHAPDIGGGFGMKIMMHPEYALCALVAKDTGRPVKWIGDRSESFLSDIQARDLVSDVEGAFDAEGHLLAIRSDSLSNLGAYHSSAGPAIHTVFSVGMVGAMYRLPCFHSRVRGVFTTTTPTDAYRGAGRPEVVHCTERLMDVAARHLNIDPVAFRRKNLLTPNDAPYTTPGGLAFDSLDPERLIDAALIESDYDGFDSRAADSTASGTIRGRAAIYYMERTGGAPFENTRLEIGTDGATTIYIGTQSTGQGHETTWPQIISDLLGLEFDEISVAEGDSDLLKAGGGTGGSRSAIMAGIVLKRASEDIIEQAHPIAADELEAAVEDIEFQPEQGAFEIVGTDKRITLKAIAAKMGGLIGNGVVNERLGSFPNGCHVAEVEIDRDTGALTLDRYTLMDDFGKIVNPMIAGGQAQGGVVQGAGQAMMEQAVYDPETGQPLTGSFMDYVMPRAADFPALEPNFIEIPCTTNPFGVKGCGEAGTVAAIPAVTLAVHDALSRAGGELIQSPFTSERLWRALNSSSNRD